MTNLRYQLLVADLDGTLLSGNDIAPGALEALNMMRRAGGYFTVATGRMFVSASRFVKAVEPNVPLILYNGAVITDPNGKIMDVWTIPRDVVTETIEFCREKNVYLNFFTSDEVFRERPTKSVVKYLKKDRIKPKKVACLLELANEKESVKLQLAGEKARLDEVVDELRSRVEGAAAVARSEDYYFEIGPKGKHKGAAVEWTARKLKIPMKDVVVVGDSMNDLPMLESAAIAGGLAVCVSNAKEELKSVPGVCVVASNEEGGVASTIIDYVLAESEAVLEQYKVAVQTYFHQDNILQRRNQFFLLVNTALLGVAGLTEALSGTRDAESAGNRWLLGAVGVFGFAVFVLWRCVYHRGGLYIRQVKAHLRFLEMRLGGFSLFTRQENLFYDGRTMYPGIFRGDWRLSWRQRMGQQVAERFLSAVLGIGWLVIIFVALFVM